MFTIATLASAKAKYARRTAAGASAYNASKGRAVQNYGSGIARFLGRPAAGHILAAYQAGMSAAEYRGGDPEKWERPVARAPAFGDGCSKVGELLEA